MESKIDENLHPDVEDLLQRHGHDAVTVRAQGLRGSDDARLAEVCKREQRALVTLDLHFSDIRLHPPLEFPGIVVRRLPVQSRRAACRVLTRVLPLIASEKLRGALWIVEEHVVRIHEGGASP